MSGLHSFIQPMPVQFAGLSGSDLQAMPMRGALGEFFDPMQPGLTSCISGSAAANEVLHGGLQAACRGEVVVLSVHSDAPALMTIELSDDGHSWRRAAWFSVQAGAEAVLRFVPSSAWWRPAITPDRDAALVSVFAQSRVF